MEIRSRELRLTVSRETISSQFFFVLLSWVCESAAWIATNLCFILILELLEE